MLLREFSRIIEALRMVANWRALGEGEDPGEQMNPQIAQMFADYWKTYTENAFARIARIMVED